jgi:hypothetical protein
MARLRKVSSRHRARSRVRRNEGERILRAHLCARPSALPGRATALMCSLELGKPVRCQSLPAAMAAANEAQRA